ncbi:MAG: hypothetical protein AAF726_05705 [Planctomycetota bacterium]
MPFDPAEWLSHLFRRPASDGPVVALEPFLAKAAPPNAPLDPKKVEVTEVGTLDGRLRLALRLQR